MWTISVCQDKHYHHRFPSKNNGQSTVVENYCLYLFILSLQPTSLIDDFSLPNMNMNMNKFSGTRTWRRTNFALFRTTIRSSHPMFFGLRARCSDQDEFVPFKELFPAPSIPFQSYPKRVPARRVIKIRGRFGLTETGRVFNVTISDPFFFRTGDCERAKNTQKYRTKQLDQHTSHSLPKPKKTNNKTMGEMV